MDFPLWDIDTVLDPTEGISPTSLGHFTSPDLRGVWPNFPIGVLRGSESDVTLNRNQIGHEKCRHDVDF